MKIDKEALKKKIHKFTQKVQPITQTAERVISFASQFESITASSAIGLASTGLNSINDFLKPTPEKNCGTGMLGSWYQQELLLNFFLKAGAVRLEDDSTAIQEFGINALTSSEGEVHVLFEKTIIKLHKDGDIWLTNCKHVDILKSKVIKILDENAPKSLKLVRKKDILFVDEFSLSKRIHTEHSDKILNSTLPILNFTGRRCILLNGKPGVGKTTTAYDIAIKSNLGRVLIIDTQASKDEDLCFLSNDVLSNTTLGVIIVDDIDKLNPDVGDIEMLRNNCKLLILTANNAEHDDVLDAAVIRAGRVDEIFTITASGENLNREAPFDRLTDEQWKSVCNWPVAYLNELRFRIVHRGTDDDALRIDEMQDRIDRKTISGDASY